MLEGNAVQVRIAREQGQDGAMQVQLAAKDGTATAGTDHTFAASTSTLEDGQDSLLVSIPTINRARNQGTRQFTVELSNATNGAVLGSATSLSVTLTESCYTACDHAKRFWQ